MLRRAFTSSKGAFALTGTSSESLVMGIGAMQTSSRRSGLVMHTPKGDVELGRFNFIQQYNNFRDQSGRVPDYYVDKYRATFWRIDEYIRRAENYIQSQGFFYLPTLDFPWYKGCMPLMSSYQIRVHYGRHHRAYLEKLNQLIEGTPLYGFKLDDVIKQSADNAKFTGVFQNAAQHFNHCFFWKCIQPYGSNIPPDLAAAVAAQYGSVSQFESLFINTAQNLFGSGWVYWVYDKNANAFDIISFQNAGCPLTTYHQVPLLCVDVWEHAYYIDYENDRAHYLSKYFEVVDWHWAERHWKRATDQPYHDMKYW